MSQQGPLLIVTNAARPWLAASLDRAHISPSIEASWAEAIPALTQVQPAAVLAVMAGARASEISALAKHVAARKPYLPLLALDPNQDLPDHDLPDNAMPFGQGNNQGATPGADDGERLAVRLRAALRIRTLDATVLRRLDEPKTREIAGDTGLPDSDPLDDATVLLLGRGASYPALSVALGERVAVVGALSIEAAAKHLSSRDIDGVVLGEGFTPRVVDAFLTVLAEDTRFRNLAVALTANPGLSLPRELANIEVISGAPSRIAANVLPLIRQHALENRLNRTLRAIDAGGLLDPQTGLLTKQAFARDFAAAVTQSLANGSGLAAARFAFDPAHARAQFDGARIISRLMRRMDFGTCEGNGSVIVVFAEADLRAAHAITRRLSSVMRHTAHGKRDARTEPSVTVAALQKGDTARTLLARLYDTRQRAAS